MPPQNEKLRQAIDQLHEALGSTHDVDPEARGLLERALREVRTVLEPKPEAAGLDTEAGPEARSVLSEAALKFEGTHPTLAGTVQSVIDALAQMGI